jgi:hypothetical protein
VDADELEREFKKVPSSFAAGFGEGERVVKARTPSDGQVPFL